ncbi:hypothetical protein PP1Y_AT28896 [Novosphingobium sp. PP1Y]|nr:hypothetical protein PP1Y_AT28896 [Novosphingobium sp. PP1Y]
MPGRIPIWLPKLVEAKRRHLSQAKFERFYASVSAEHAKLNVMLGLYSMARPTGDLAA